MKCLLRKQTYIVIVLIPFIIISCTCTLISPDNKEEKLQGVSGQPKFFFSSSQEETKVSRCPEFVRRDCNQICQPNDYRVNCDIDPNRIPTCLCLCPSLEPIYSFCDFRPSSYCTISCGRGGIGYNCIGPSGLRQCACFCPRNREANTETEADNKEEEENTNKTIIGGQASENKTEFGSFTSK